MPLSPEVICGGLAEASSDLDIDIRAKLVVLKLFERLLVDKTGSTGTVTSCWYQPVSCPIQRSPVAGSAACVARPRPSRPAAARSAESSDDEEDGQSLTFNELSALLHQQGGPVVESNARGKALATSDLLSQLDELQVSASNTEPPGPFPCGSNSSRCWVLPPAVMCRSARLTVMSLIWWPCCSTSFSKTGNCTRS